MNNKNLTLGSLVSVAVTIIAAGVIVYALLAVYALMSMKCGSSAFIFSIVNLVIVIVVVNCGKAIVKRTSSASYVQLISATFFYTALQFGQLFFTVNSWNESAYVLCHLAILVVWMVFAGAKECKYCGEALSVPAVEPVVQAAT
jgi:hypothetical protein